MSETIKIEKCPLCSNSHVYKLAVERSWIVKMIQFYDSVELSRKIKFTRIFICPEKNQEFQNVFYLSETDSDEINNVTVVGIASDEDVE